MKYATKDFLQEVRVKAASEIVLPLLVSYRHSILTTALLPFVVATVLPAANSSRIPLIPPLKLHPLPPNYCTLIEG